MADGAHASAESLGLVERVAALHRVQLFAGIPGRVLAAVAEVAIENRLSGGDVLMEEGAVEAHLFAVVKGSVRVHRGDRTLVELGPGATVGELAVLMPAPRAASVTALEPTLVLRVDKTVLDELLVDWPELAVLMPAPRAASVTALEPTLVLRVDKTVLDELLVDWPELAHGVITELVSRLRATTEFTDRGS